MSDTVNLFIFLDRLSQLDIVTANVTCIPCIKDSRLCSDNRQEIPWFQEMLIPSPHTHTYTNYGNPIILCSD